MKIFLLSGWATSGKDVVADYLSTKGFLKLSFAEYLKKQVSDLYEIDYNLTLTQEGKNSIVKTNNGLFTVRGLLIKHATEKRLENRDVFVEKIIKSILECDKKEIKGFVVSDCRFLNEIECLKKLKQFKVITVRINRHEKSPVYSFTEHFLDDYNFDYVLENKDTIKSLKNKIDDLILKN
jgi:dephospho-CoA kinase